MRNTCTCSFHYSNKKHFLCWNIFVPFQNIKSVLMENRKTLILQRKMNTSPYELYIFWYYIFVKIIRKASYRMVCNRIFSFLFFFLISFNNIYLGIIIQFVYDVCFHLNKCTTLTHTLAVKALAESREKW